SRKCSRESATQSDSKGDSSSTSRLSPETPGSTASGSAPSGSDSISDFTESSRSRPRAWKKSFVLIRFPPCLLFLLYAKENASCKLGSRQSHIRCMRFSVFPAADGETPTTLYAGARSLDHPDCARLPESGAGGGWLGLSHSMYHSRTGSSCVSDWYTSSSVTRSLKLCVLTLPSLRTTVA